MKKLLVAVLVIVLLFAVIGCNTGEGSGSNPIPEDPNKNEIKDPILPNDPILPDEPVIPDEPIVPDNPSSPEKPVEPEEPTTPKGPTLFSHINELAENVDETPEFEIKDDSTTYYRARKKQLAENVTEVDITNPQNNENYANYILSDRYFWNSEHTRIKNANLYIDYVKSVKDEIITFVTMLNTWVYDASINCKYRIQYDQASDLVYLERIAEGNLYIRITSTYVNGKMAIDAYQYQIYNENDGSEISFHYVEDQVLYYYEMAHVADKNVFLLASDLSANNPVNVCLSYSTMDQGDRISYQMFKYLYKMGVEGDSGLDVFNSYFLDGFTEEFGNFNDTVIINNSNDDFVFRFQNSEHSYFYTLDLYELTGYSQIIRGNNNYKLVVGNNTFISENSDSHGENNSITYETADYSAMAFLNEYGTCQLVVSVDLINKDLSASSALTDFLNYLGLSFKDQTIYDKLNVLDNSSQILSQYSFFDYSYSYYVSPAQIDHLFNINKLHSVSYADVMEMLDADFVYVNEQVEDSDYYLLYSSGVSGTVSYNANNTFNLSNVTITLSDSGILTSGEQYSLVAYLSDGYKTYFLNKQSVTFEGVSVSINLNDNVALPSDLTIGKYHVVAYLATEINSQDIRVSAIYTLAGESEFDAFSAIEKDGESYFVRVVSTSELTIAMDNAFELTGQVAYVEQNQCLNLSGIVGSLSNGYVLLESDLITLSATFYDSDDAIVKVIEDKFFFGDSALSASVYMEEIPALPLGTYQLKITFSVVDKNDNVLFGAEHKNETSLNAIIVDEQRTDVDLISINAFEEYIEFEYAKVASVNMNATYENQVIDFSASSLDIICPDFFENTDLIFIDIYLIPDNEDASSLLFSANSSYGLLDTELVFPTINLLDYSIEGGTYKVEYLVIFTNQNYENKLVKYYETDLVFDIASTLQ